MNKTSEEEQKLVEYSNQQIPLYDIYTNEELLNWAMNQLFRAARHMDLMKASQGSIGREIPSIGCDMTAKVILRRLTSTEDGRKLVESTNSQLLED